MKINDSIPLTKEMLDPFLTTQTKEVVVRIYKKQKWFIGLLSSISIDNGDECKLRVEPMAEYTPQEAILAEIELDHGLVKSGDPMIRFSDRWPPFTLVSPHKVLLEKECGQTLIMQFSDGLAIVSTRDEDICDVIEFISLARKLSK
ncbi:MAG: hypothetical protein PHG25_00845 [Candidatus Pacebacteria bacterium]|nr:hypothetical protein [Candidatus Paceibacterota bacterium]